MKKQLKMKIWNDIIKFFDNLEEKVKQKVINSKSFKRKAQKDWDKIFGKTQSPRDKQKYTFSYNELEEYLREVLNDSRDWIIELNLKGPIDDETREEVITRWILKYDMFKLQYKLFNDKDF